MQSLIKYKFIAVAVEHIQRICFISEYKCFALIQQSNMMYLWSPTEDAGKSYKSI